MSVVLGPAAASVGLQVLLQPYGAGIQIGRAACTCVGLLYPAYRSLESVEVLNPLEGKKWLIYWSIYGLIAAAERPLDGVLQWVPYYHAVKLLLLVWLQSSSYEGARRIYLEGLRPWLAGWQPSIDDFLASLLRSLRRPELQMLSEGFHHFASRTPLLEWFVRGPDGRVRAQQPAFITESREPEERRRR